MAELADVFRHNGAAYLDRFGDRMPTSHRHAIRNVAVCRTEALGGHLAKCNHCGHLRHSYHSCRNRSCPKCHGTDTKRWLEKRQDELLSVPYFHVIFTLPKELQYLVRAHQKALGSVLFLAAARSLKELAADPRYVGGDIGILCVLHTWTRAMIWHPHIHCLVPAGGLSQDGKWREPKGKNYLVPVIALSKIYRAKFMSLARKTLPGVTFPESVWETDWVVYSKPSMQGADRVLKYLARYIHRIAITNNRILSVYNGEVTFRYKDSREHRWKTMTLSADEFMRRFLQHVLPRGFHKVRYYGLLSPANRGKLKQIRELMRTNTDAGEEVKEEDKTPDTISPIATLLCPHCKIGLLVLVSFLEKKCRVPP